jgi:hypothetical protein
LQHVANLKKSLEWGPLYFPHPPRWLDFLKPKSDDRKRFSSTNFLRSFGFVKSQLFFGASRRWPRQEGGDLHAPPPPW